MSVHALISLILLLGLALKSTTAQSTSTSDPFQCTSDADCLNNGKCISGVTSNLCECPPGYGGDNCASSCPRVCQNGGSCRFDNDDDISHGSDQDGTTFCQCPPNFTGVDCELPYVQCGQSLQCLHGGTCHTNNQCDCPSPRVGDQCQYDSPNDPRIPPFECQADSDCLNGGTCVQLQSDDNYCQCPAGFGGDDCSSSCNQPCQNGGSCRFHGDISHGSDQDGNTYCECPPHQFTGVHCEIPFVSCPGLEEVKCLYGGTCQRETQGYQCDCPGTRTGLFCQFASAEEEAQAARTTDASASSTSGNNDNNNNSYDESSYNESLKMALILLVAALVGAGILTGAAMCLCKRTTTPIDTRNETSVVAPNDEVC